MPSKGEYIEFKPGTQGIREPDNYGIFIKTRKTKRQINYEIFTIDGKKEINKSKVLKKKLGDFIHLKNNQLPSNKELKKTVR